jgi:hypothetical protein
MGQPVAVVAVIQGCSVFAGWIGKSLEWWLKTFIWLEMEAIEWFHILYSLL